MLLLFRFPLPVSVCSFTHWQSFIAVPLLLTHKHPHVQATIMVFNPHPPARSQKWPPLCFESVLVAGKLLVSSPLVTSPLPIYPANQELLLEALMVFLPLVNRHMKSGDLGAGWVLLILDNDL